VKWSWATFDPSQIAGKRLDGVLGEWGIGRSSYGIVICCKQFAAALQKLIW
jgi:hypothetical protein